MLPTTVGVITVYYLYFDAEKNIPFSKNRPNYFFSQGLTGHTSDDFKILISIDIFLEYMSQQGKSLEHF